MDDIASERPWLISPSILMRTEASATAASQVAGGGVPNTGKTIRLRDKDHLKFVSKQPCVVCGREPSDAHHLRFAQPRALGRKVGDKFTVPVCRLHRRELHRENGGPTALPSPTLRRNQPPQGARQKDPAHALAFPAEHRTVRSATAVSARTMTRCIDH
jgi:hypothetical protein